MKSIIFQKFFDSGDYAMDKSKAGTGLGSKPHPLAGGPPPAAPPVVAQRSPAPAATTPSPSASPISQQTNRPSSDRNSDDDNLQVIFQ